MSDSSLREKTNNMFILITLVYRSKKNNNKMWKKYNIEIDEDEILSDYDENVDYSELAFDKYEDELNLNYDDIFEENNNVESK